MKVSRFQNIYLIICFLGLGLNGAYCQVTKNIEVPLGVIVEDTLFVEDSYHCRQIPPIRQSKNLIEIRFNIHTSFGQFYEQYVFLIFDKNWSAKYYHYDEGKEEYVFEPIAENINLDSVFNRLVADYIFSLPDFSQLELNSYKLYPKTNEIVGEYFGVDDAQSYSITFKVGQMYRHYSFKDPSFYEKIYEGSYELKLFSDIVKTFESLIQE